MATRLYGLSLGEGAVEQVSEGVGSATASDNIELTVDLAVITSREQVFLALRRFEEKILMGSWPPA